MKRCLSLLLSLMLLLTTTGCGKNQAGTSTESSSVSSSLSWQEQYDLGLFYLADGNYEEAITAFTAAIELDPKQSDTYQYLSQAYENQKNYDSARDVLTRGLEATGDTALQAWLDELANIGHVEQQQEDEWEVKITTYDLAGRVIKMYHNVVSSGFLIYTYQYDAADVTISCDSYSEDFEGKLHFSGSITYTMDAADHYVLHDYDGPFDYEEYGLGLFSGLDFYEFDAQGQHLAYVYYQYDYDFDSNAALSSSSELKATYHGTQVDISCYEFYIQDDESYSWAYTYTMSDPTHLVKIIRNWGSNTIRLAECESMDGMLCGSYLTEMIELECEPVIRKGA